MYDLVIIIVNWNGEKFIEACLSSVLNALRNVKFNTKVICVDNNSSDNSRSFISKFENICKIYNKSNLGFAKANNEAIKLYKSKYYLLLNPDTIIVDQNNFDIMLSFMEDNPKVGIAGCKITYEDGQWQSSIGHFANLITGFSEQIKLNIFIHKHKLFKRVGSFCSKYFNNLLSHFNETMHQSCHPLDVQFVLGAYLMVRSQVIENIGLLDEVFFIFGEENDFCYRAIKNGWKVKFVPYTKIVHLGSQSQKQVFDKMYYWHIAVYFWYFHKHNKTKYYIWNFITLIIQLILYIFNNIIGKRNSNLIHKSLMELTFCTSSSLPQKMFDKWEIINSY